MGELKSMAADIITLQEVQKDAYDDWFRPQLAEAGYEGIFQQKKREPIFHKGKYTAEGCGTFYKTTRFKRVDKHVVDYDKLTDQEVRTLLGREQVDKGLQRFSKGNIALVVILEDLHIKATHASQATGPNGGHVLCVVNTHILCDPGSADVKLCQAYLLLQTLEKMPIKNIPRLICGDFNSTPESAVYEYLRRGSVRADHPDLANDPCGIVNQLTLRHSLPLATAYETCNGREATYTNYTEHFKGTLDYIWFSPDALAVLAISQVDDEPQLTQEIALPSSTRPSDHMSLVATFMFHEPSADNQEGQSGQRSGGRGGSQLPGAGGPTAAPANPYHMGAGNPMVANSGLTANGSEGVYTANGALPFAQYL